MSNNVVRLPFRGKSESNPDRDPEQFELFNRQEKSVHGWVLIDPNQFSQSKFLQLIARNKFDFVIDLRVRPLFEKPTFNHKFVVSYFQERSINYIDIAKAAHAQKGELEEFFKYLKFESKRTVKDVSSFYTLCLADRQTVESNVVALFRQTIREFGDHVIEMHPSSILS